MAAIGNGCRTCPDGAPGDLQLYYQTLLIGRKELPQAPGRRMGVRNDVTVALAFHPRMPLPEPETPRRSFAPVANGGNDAAGAATVSGAHAPQTSPRRCWRYQSGAGGARSTTARGVNDKR